MNPRKEAAMIVRRNKGPAERTLSDLNPKWRAKTTTANRRRRHNNNPVTIPKVIMAGMMETDRKSVV